VILIAFLLYRNTAKMECIKRLGHHKKFIFIHLQFSLGELSNNFLFLMNSFFFSVYYLYFIMASLHLGSIQSGLSTSLSFQLTSTICGMLLPLNHHGLQKLHHIFISSEHSIQLSTNITGNFFWLLSCLWLTFNNDSMAR
jgi:hypothetical protein